MITKIKGKVYEYEHMVIESLKIPKILRDEINKFCKEKNIVKSKLIEAFYESILSGNVSSDLNINKGFLTINIFDKKIKKKSKTKVI